jgi:hypothetical protein
MQKSIGSAAGVLAAMCWLLLCMRPVYGQQLLSSFEGDLSSSVGATWEGPGIANSSFVSVGATEGTMALAVKHVPNWTIQLILKGGLPLAQAVANHDFLLIDVTTQDLGVAADMWSPAWRQLITVINSNQGGWQQQDNNYPVAGDDGGFLTQTVILDLNQVLSAPNSLKQNAQNYVASGGGAGTWFELFLPMQGGDQNVPPIPGDFTNDLVVNAADYVVWRENDAANAALPNDTGLTTQAARYDLWKANFGTDRTLITTIIDNVRLANAGAGAVVGAVPEPAAVLLALMGALTFGIRRRPSA